jgi:RimJ/RimL family protein N-acetyltransferase/catechol 2,3-dioxygenase-like lactoylglutathione lyase family enzyme
VRLHHVQLAMPAGGEDEARRFFGGALGMEEVPKPPELATRGGVWFRRGDVELHLGVEEAFSPATKAHPGILVDDLDGLADALRAAGHDVTPDTRLPGYRRFYARDCFGNRLEFLTRVHDPVPTLTTDRLTLRAFRPDDVGDVEDYASDEEVARFVPTVPWPYTRADAEAFVRGPGSSDPTVRPMFAIEYEGRVIGGCSLGIDAHASTAELGYALGRRWRGRGLATEAARALVAHGFGHHDLAVIWARADVRNVASHRVLEKIGMTYEGTLRGRVVSVDGRRDDRTYSILRDDWAERTRDPPASSTGRRRNG